MKSLKDSQGHCKDILIKAKQKFNITSGTNLKQICITIISCAASDICVQHFNPRLEFIGLNSGLSVGF